MSWGSKAGHKLLLPENKDISATDFAALREELMLRIWAGFDNVPYILVNVMKELEKGSFPGLQGKISEAEVESLLKTMFAEKMAEEKTWTTEPSGDRLGTALLMLNHQGIASLENAETVVSQGFEEFYNEYEFMWDYRCREADKFIGACFYNVSDCNLAVKGGPMVVHFVSASGTQEDNQLVGGEVMSQLKSKGFSPEWDGQSSDITFPITWQKRFKG